MRRKTDLQHLEDFCSDIDGCGGDVVLALIDFSAGLKLPLRIKETLTDTWKRTHAHMPSWLGGFLRAKELHNVSKFWNVLFWNWCFAS